MLFCQHFMFQVQEWKCIIICLHSNLLFLYWLYVTSLCFIYRYVYHRLFIFYFNISHLYIVPMLKPLIIKIICTIEFVLFCVLFFFYYLIFFLTKRNKDLGKVQTIPECAKIFLQLILSKLNEMKRIRARDPFIEMDAIRCKYLKYVELQFGMLQFKDCIVVYIHAICTYMHQCQLFSACLIRIIKYFRHANLTKNI